MPSRSSAFFSTRQYPHHVVLNIVTVPAAGWWCIEESLSRGWQSFA